MRVINRKQTSHAFMFVSVEDLKNSGYFRHHGCSILPGQPKWDRNIKSIRTMTISSSFELHKRSEYFKDDSGYDLKGFDYNF